MFRDLGQSLKGELAVYRRVLAHPQTPWLARGVLALAVGYALMPLDLIPDWIPVLGHLDDVLIVPGLVWVALRMIPPQVVVESRQQVQEDCPA